MKVATGYSTLAGSNAAQEVLTYSKNIFLVTIIIRPSNAMNGTLAPAAVCVYTLNTSRAVSERAHSSKMPSLSDCLPFALLLVCAAQTTRIPTRPVLSETLILTGSIFQRPANIPAACRPQTKCPAAPDLFTCAVYEGGDCTSFCTRTINQYMGQATLCGQRVSALGRHLLFRTCKSQCRAVRPQLAKPRAVSAREQAVLRMADCSGRCRARIWAQARRRRPNALVIAALRGTKNRPGFYVFSPWMWREAMCKKVQCITLPGHVAKCAARSHPTAAGFVRGSGLRARQSARPAGASLWTAPFHREKRNVVRCSELGFEPPYL